MPFLEIVAGQSQEVPDQVACDLEAQEVPENPQGPPAKRLDRTLHDDECAKGQRDDDEQVMIALCQRLVDDELHLERRNESGDLERCREHEHLQQRTGRACDPRPQHRQLHRCLGGDGLETLGPRNLQDHAGEVLGELLQAYMPYAEGRIVDGRRFTAERLENNEVTEVPVQNGRQVHLAERAQLHPQGAGGEAELIGNAHDAAERRARERHGEALPQAVEVDVVAVEPRDHGHAGEPAFRRLGGDDRGKAPPAYKAELVENAHERPATA